VPVGAHGPRPKDPERRQRPRVGDPPKTELALLPSKFALPKPPAGLLKSSRTEWDALFGSELGRMVDPDTDLPALRRLFRYRDQLERLHAATLEEGFQVLVLGSTKQPTLNPVYKAIRELEAQILALEDRFGLNLRQRMALGAQVVDTAKSLDALNGRLDEQRNAEPRPAPLDLATQED
jgi:hypothetical protein